jgi:hypothetical protein
VRYRRHAYMDPTMHGTTHIGPVDIRGIFLRMNSRTHIVWKKYFGCFLFFHGPVGKVYECLRMCACIFFYEHQCMGIIIIVMRFL